MSAYRKYQPGNEAWRALVEAFDVLLVERLRALAPSGETEPATEAGEQVDRVAEARGLLWEEAESRMPDDPDRAYDIILHEEIRRAGVRLDEPTGPAPGVQAETEALRKALDRACISLTNEVTHLRNDHIDNLRALDSSRRIQAVINDLMALTPSGETEHPAVEPIQMVRHRLDDSASIDFAESLSLRSLLDHALSLLTTQGGGDR